MKRFEKKKRDSRIGTNNFLRITHILENQEMEITTGKKKTTQ